jgi:hypothetical protein
MSIRMLSGLSAVTFAAVAAFALAPAAEAKVYKLHFVMTGKAETPPNDSRGKGAGSVTFDSQTNDLSWHITWSGLTGDATAAHFHGLAKPGVAAPPILPIHSKPMESPLIGSQTITPDQAKDLLAGLWYFNVHTAANPMGELRGQVLIGGGKVEPVADAAAEPKAKKHKAKKEAPAQ